MKQISGYFGQHKFLLAKVSVIILVMIFAIWLAFASTFSKMETQKPSEHPIDELRSHLIQNGISLDTIAFIDASSPASAEQHKIIASRLDQAIKNSKDSLARSDSKFKSEIDAALSKEADILNLYRENSNHLYKVLSYNPADDIGSLNAETQKEEIAQRASATSNALGTILDKTILEGELTLAKDKIKLSASSITALNNSKGCFEKLSNAQINRSECVKLYDEARQTINNNLIGMLNNDEMKEIKSQLQKIVSELSSNR